MVSLNPWVISGQKPCFFEAIGGLPNITADGHDVLEQLFGRIPAEHIVAEILKEATRKTI
jgi:hypothetical protein